MSSAAFSLEGFMAQQGNIDHPCQRLTRGIDMTDSQEPKGGIQGEIFVNIPFPPKGTWAELGQSLPLGEGKQGLCNFSFYKSADNRLHVYAQFATWGSRYIKTDIPLSVPDVGVSKLYIRWGDKRVVLRQDNLPAIEVDWQFPD
jgi:hypothetical protein